ncbi:PTHR1 [Acanthosepion pharaonis]|uniref:PTHR1 n=1 Tax=Acanthosepion pharaonis TaxID=158019 RepID=A0A812DLE8_ACAPH|nr:PTHR1 [Sepia pharaonis]
MRGKRDTSASYPRNTTRSFYSPSLFFSLSFSSLLFSLTNFILRRPYLSPPSFLSAKSHWQCKLLFSLFHYILAANYIWIFIEGLYLHNLITVALFSKKSGVRPYIIGGWGFPFTFVLPWVIVRLLLEDTLCWNTHSNKAYFWIMRGPIMATVIVNFIFFVNIIRILFTKLSMNRPQRARNFRYRRLAKSTLVLIPLFGVHYMVFLGLPDDIGEVAELVKLYFEMLLNSFQGFFVAILFCYMNAEVQSELQKVWLRRKRGRMDSATLPRTHWQTVMTSSIMRHCSSLRLMNSTSINEKRAQQAFCLQNKPQSLSSTNRDPKQTPSIPNNLLNTNGKVTVTKLTPTASVSKLTTFPIVTTTTVHAKTAGKKHNRESPV